MYRRSTCCCMVAEARLLQAYRTSELQHSECPLFLDVPFCALGHRRSNASSTGLKLTHRRFLLCPSSSCPFELAPSTEVVALQPLCLLLAPPTESVPVQPIARLEAGLILNAPQVHTAACAAGCASNARRPFAHEGRRWSPLSRWPARPRSTSACPGTHSAEDENVSN
jgi:hypothetical protein